MLTAHDLDLQLKIDDADDGAALRRAATQLAERWPALRPPKQREVLLKVGARVVVDERRVELSAMPEHLTALLLKSTAKVTQQKGGRCTRVSKSIDASLVKTAGETRILEEEIVPVAAALTPGHKTLLKAIAQGRAWAIALTTGELISAEEITLKTGASAAHVARSLKCLRIPPDLVSRLVEGKAPADLTWGLIRSLGESDWTRAIGDWRAA